MPWQDELNSQMGNADSILMPKSVFFPPNECLKTSCLKWLLWLVNVDVSCCQVVEGWLKSPQSDGSQLHELMPRRGQHFLANLLITALLRVEGSYSLSLL